MMLGLHVIMSRRLIREINMTQIETDKRVDDRKDAWREEGRREKERVS